MVNYKKMYYRLFNQISDTANHLVDALVLQDHGKLSVAVGRAIIDLQEAQQYTEEEYLDEPTK